MRRRLAPILLVLLVACGEEPPTDEPPTLASDPRGEAVEVRYDAPDGATWKAEITLETRVSQRRTGGPRAGTSEVEGNATIEMRWTVRRPPGGAPHSVITFRFVEAEGDQAEAFLARAALTGRLEHEQGGRPRPETLAFEGGTPEEQQEALNLVGALLFAGYGGSPTWVPPRPVRAGEAWDLAPFVALRALRRVDTPDLAGMARVKAVREIEGERVLDLEVDARLSVRKGAESAVDRFEGEAVVSASTGVPRTFRVVHRGRKEARSEGARVTLEFTSEARGRVERLGER